MSKTQHPEGTRQATETVPTKDKASEVPTTTGKSQGSRQMERSAIPGSQIVYGNYGSIITTKNPTWKYGGFPQPDGTFWQYREPNAVVVVEGDRLRVAAVPLTRSHDQVQILDNAKNMYFSTQMFEPPEQGTITLEWWMSARGIETAPRDLYDGFVSVNLLDFANGLALDVFMSNDVIATVYARLPFPGVPVPEETKTDRPKYFCYFHELELPTKPGTRHDCKIAYTKSTDELIFWIDGVEVSHYTEVPAKMGSFLIALGLMTEKAIHQGKSASLHGQGLIGEWGPFTITKSL